MVKLLLFRMNDVSGKQMMFWEIIIGVGISTKRIPNILQQHFGMTKSIARVVPRLQKGEKKEPTAPLSLFFYC